MASAARNTTPSTTDAADTTTSKAEADALRTTTAAAEAEAPMSAADAPAASADDPANKGKVPITLAHPIENEEHMRRLRLDVKEGGYGVHDVVYLTPDDARALINAGLAQVDPEDPTAVRAALTGKQQD